MAIKLTLEHFWEAYKSNIRDSYAEEHGHYAEDDGTIMKFLRSSFYTGALSAHVLMTEESPFTSDELASRLANLERELDGFKSWLEKQEKNK